MNLERYPYFTHNFKDYVFFSTGPKGRIKKVIRFTLVEDDPVIYNLAFGDERQNNNGEIDDLVVSNNGDANIVLATVINTVFEFSNHYNNPYVHAKGSTPARTRLYQMGIAALLNEISAEFDVYGLKGGFFYPFQKNVNYDSFLVKENNVVNLIYKNNYARN